MLFLDTETYSETPIKNGTYRYAQDAELMVATWAFDDCSVQCWDATEDPIMPSELYDYLTALCDPEYDPTQLLTAHNSMFDRNILKYAAGLDIPRWRWRDTMVQALAHALPGSLDKLGAILGVADEDKKLGEEGKKLIHLFCKPRPKNSKLRRATRLTHPKEWARFLEYAKQDIPAMRAIAKKLPTWNYKGAEVDLWHLDQKINDRGFCIDTELADAALRATERAQKALAEACCTATGGAVESATKRDQLLGHILLEYGIELPDMQGSTLERRIADPDIPEGVKELLRIRLQASSTSTSKYKTLKKSVSPDGRLRGTLQFDGAGRTRRDAGRTFQPQNLPSRGILDHDAVERGIAAMKADCEDLLYDNVMLLTSSALRGCIIAPPGKKLVVADLSNIEGRDTAWLAGEEWKLQAFRNFDDGIGADLYKMAYAKSFGIAPEAVNKDQRQVGKVQELALGYAGGVGAFVTFSLVYGIDLEAMGEEAYGSIPGNILHDAEGFYDWTLKKKRPTFGLSRRAFVVCEAFKRLWRGAHPQTASLWEDIESAAKWAVNNPGESMQVRRMKVRRDGAWLRIGLPSGRCLCYPSPQLSDSGQLSYMGQNQYTRQWQRIKTFGGKIVENCAQSVARDVMFDSLPRIEAAGYDIVLRVHDEVVTEAPDSDEFNPEHLSSLLATNHDWCEDLPLAAAGFEGYRYRK